MLKHLIAKIRNARLMDMEWNIPDADLLRNLLMALMLIVAATAIVANQHRHHVYLPLQEAGVVFM